MSKRNIFDRVLWMQMPLLETLSSELVNKRRQERRYPVHSEVELVSMLTGEETTVRVTNISKSGAGVEGGGPLEVGSMVALVITSAVMSGQVRWCRIKDDGTFAAGIMAERVGLIQWRRRIRNCGVDLA